MLRSFWNTKKPPVAPYSLPFLGHALSFFHDTSIVAQFQRDSQAGVIGLKFWTTSINFVTGANNIARLWRCKDLDASAVTSFSLKQFFLTPEKSMEVYLGDDSGISPQPHPLSNIAEKNRYYYQNRKAIVGFFNGPGLMSMGNRFSHLLVNEIHRLEVPDDWINETDLYSFVLRVVIGPAVEAMCGPVLLEENPNFGNDFWKMDHDIFYFFKGYPKWLAPSAFQNRIKLLNGVKHWHTFARSHFDATCIESDGHDRFYGSPLMRSRQQYLTKIDCLDADAIASQDLGLLWAENANSVPAIFWMLYETLQRPDLFSQVIEVITSSSKNVTKGSPINIEVLCNQPLLQSMYAETLRLYTSLFALRSAAHGSVNVDKFTIPKNDLIAVDSRVCAMNPDLWGTGSIRDNGTENHPLNNFWAERFIVRPDDPTSGPLRSTCLGTKGAKPDLSTRARGKEPYFSMDGLAGGWIPFGGGNRQCPGRSFAKQEIIVGFSLIVSMLDIELLTTDEIAIRKPDMRYYGLGTLPPKGMIPFRFRKRTPKDLV
ncbi:MAG: hypothetical protein Q9224_001843 [Gallowayella concinna]